jgi:hypothetical protein
MAEMTMRRPDSQKPKLRHPLLAVTAVALFTMAIPFVIAGVAPEGPAREGDTVFASGKHVVYFRDPARFMAAGYVNHCVLEPRDQLLVLPKIGDVPDDTLVTRMETKKARAEQPFCPIRAELLVKAHQVMKRDGLLAHLQDAVARLARR